MLDIFKQYATDETLENEGAWRQLGAAKFLVARSGNRKYVKRLTSEFEKHKISLELKDDSAESLSDRIMVDVMAESILLGWEGVAYKGAPMVYSKENAKTLLGHKDFRKEISKFSEDLESYQLKEELDLGKT